MPITESVYCYGVRGTESMFCGSRRNVHRKPTRKVEFDEEEGGEDGGGVAVGVGESGVEEREEEKVEEEGRRVLREKARRHASMMTAGVD
eukprot:2773430-Rhodomonas_salina.2